MANHERIEELISEAAFQQIDKLGKDLLALNEIMVKAILNSEKLSNTVAKTTGLKDLTTAQAKLNDELRKTALHEEKIALARVKTQAADEKRIAALEREEARKAAAEQKEIARENARIVRDAKKGKSIISNTQLEVDAYNNSVNGSKKVTSAIRMEDRAYAELTSEASAYVGASKKVVVETLKVSKAAVNAQKSINSLKIQLESYEAIANNTKNPEVLSEFNLKIQETQDKIKRLSNVGKIGFDDLGNAIKGSNSGISGAKKNLEDLANLLPGIGIGTLIGFASGPILDYISNLDIFKSKIDQVARSRQLLNEVNLNGAKDAQLEIVQLKTLYDTAKNVALSSDQRYNAAKNLQEQYPKTFENYSIEQIQLGKVEAGYLKLASSIIATARARASEEKIAENSSRQLDNEQSLIKARALLVEQTKALNVARRRAINLDKEAGDRETAGVRGDAQLRVSELTRGIKDTAREIRNIKTDNNILDQRNLDLTKNIVSQQKLGAEITSKTKEEKARKIDTSEEDSRKAKVQAARSAAKEIANDEKETFNFRLLSQVDFEETGNELAKIDYDKKVSLAKGASGKIAAAQSEYQRDLEKYQREAREVEINIREGANKALQKLLKQGLDDLNQKEKDEVQTIINANSDKLASIELYRSQAAQITAEQYADGIINKKQYEQQLLDIEAQAAADRLKVEIEGLKKIIAKEKDYLSFGVGTNQQLGADERKLANLEISLSKLTTDAKIKDKEKVAEASKRLRDTEQQIAQETLSIGVAIIDGMFTKRLNVIQSEIDASEKKKAFDIENVNNSVLSEQEKADKIAIINARADAQQTALEQKQRQEKLRQAKFDKAASIANIAMSTSVAIMKTYAEFGFPVGVPLAIAQGAIGALQIATVLATPLPTYWTGTDYSKSGPAVTDELGPELYIPKSGKPFIGSDKPNIKNLQAGTRIIPHHELVKMTAKPELNPVVNGSVIDVSAIVSSQDKTATKIIKALSNQKSHSTIITKRGWRNTQTKMNGIDQYLKRNFS